MKYIKQYENIEKYEDNYEKYEIFNRDDNVVLINNEDINNRRFIIGNIYYITLIDRVSTYKYQISELDHNYRAWVRESQIRLATPEEIDDYILKIKVNKFNI